MKKLLKKLAIGLITAAFLTSLAASSMVASTHLEQGEIGDTLGLNTHEQHLHELTPASRNNNQGNTLSEIEYLLAVTMLRSGENDTHDSEPTGLYFDFSGNLELGARLNAYRYEHRLEAINDIHWYPVLEDGRVVAIVSLHGNPQAPAITLRVEFALELQNFIDANTCEFALLFKGNNLYVASYSAKEILWTYANPVSNSPNVSYYSEVAEMQRSSISVIQELMPSVDELQLLRQLNAQEQFSSPETIQPFTARRLNVPIVLQGNFNLCWAACVVSVGRFHGSPHRSRTPVDVARIMGIPVSNGATVHETRDALLRTMYISRTAHNSGITFAQVQASINNNRPIIGGFTGGFKLGHMVVINGFERFNNTSGLIDYMDPEFGFSMTTSINPVRIVSGGQTMNAAVNIR